MSEEVKDILKIIGVIAAIIFGIFLFVFVLYLAIQPFMIVGCRQFEAVTGVPTRYSFWVGQCFAQYKNVWLPTDQIFQLIGK